MNLKALASRLAATGACTTLGELRQNLAGCVQELGFEWYSYIGRFQLAAALPVEQVLSNYPTEWQKRYSERRYRRIDPIWQHTLKHLTPVIWSRDLSQSAEQHRFFDERESFGLRYGISFSIYSPTGDPCIFSLGSTTHLEDTFLTSVSGAVATAQFLHDSVSRVTRASFGQQTTRLTEREIECLRWVAQGKTTHEISRILNLSVHGVSHHIRNLMKKFGVSKRLQAVKLGSAYGFIC